MKPKSKSTTRIFGPVPSRRLGLSLGVDLIPVKTCTYDCLYCQVGKTTRKRSRRAAFVPVREVLAELEKRLETVTPDYITLSGSGEPTLYSRMEELVSGIRKRSNGKIALITNGSLLWKEQVRKGITGVDLILPTLCTVFEPTFQLIHRPAAGLRLDRIIEGMKRLRKEYKRDLFLEVMLLRSINDSEKELEGLKRVIEEISPDRIQLNTVVRPPNDPSALPLDSSSMKEIMKFFGPSAEVIAPVKPGVVERTEEPPENTVLEMARRRPLRAVDVAKVLNRSRDEMKDLLEGLVRQGMLRRGSHAGEIFYYHRTESEQ
ncbi:MAG: radical SAM protein [Desulfobacteraceae bacterium]|nr:MAG: radical SAM protein [Desulfobacteraceae bacterium]